MWFLAALILLERSARIAVDARDRKLSFVPGNAANYNAHFKRSCTASCDLHSPIHDTTEALLDNSNMEQHPFWASLTEQQRQWLRSAGAFEGLDLVGKMSQEDLVTMFDKMASFFRFRYCVTNC